MSRFVSPAKKSLNPVSHLTRVNSIAVQHRLYSKQISAYFVGHFDYNFYNT